MRTDIHPTTLIGIKRLARQLHAAKGLKHSLALHEAAVAAGFPDYSSAHRGLSSTKAPPRNPSHPLYLTVYWKDRESGGEGRETLQLDLSTPWHELIKPQKLGTHRAFHDLVVRAPDHLERRGLCRSQSQARRAICAAARTFAFVQATGLRPASRVRGYQRVFTNKNIHLAIPGRDHESLWIDPTTERYVYAIEPYRNADFIGTLAAWGQVHGIDVAMPRWGGMYAPDYQAPLFLFSEPGRGVPLTPVIDALNALAAPLVEANWPGESAPTQPYFLSPRHGEPSLLNAARRARSGSKGIRGPRAMHWGRKLLTIGVKELLHRGLITKNSVGEDARHIQTVIAGRNSIILWSDAGFEEMRIAVWWDYDHDRHPQANLAGASKENFNTSSPLAKRSAYRRFVGATVSGWLERKTGLFLQGKGGRGLTDLYLRQDAKVALAGMPEPIPDGFATEGKFMM